MSAGSWLELAICFSLAQISASSQEAQPRYAKAGHRRAKSVSKYGSSRKIEHFLFLSLYAFL